MVENLHRALRAGENQAGIAIIIEQLCRMVTWRRQHIDDAIAEINLCSAVRPIRKAKVLALLLNIRVHQLHAIHALELRIAGAMIQMSVNVHHTGTALPTSRIIFRA
jgi:hypothetical protein